MTTSVRVQQALDEELRLAINEKHTPSQIAKVCELLDKGANPNYIKRGGYTTAVEHAAAYGYAAILWAMLFRPCATIHFEAREGFPEKSPLAFLLQTPRDLISDALCMKVYDHMKKPIHPQSHLLTHALKGKRIKMAELLISQHHGQHICGYYSMCIVTFSHSEQATAVYLARLLYDTGYRNTTHGADMRGHNCETALEVAALSQTHAMIEFLAPFATVTYKAISLLSSQSGYGLLCVQLIERSILRDMPDAPSVRAKPHKSMPAHAHVRFHDIVAAHIRHEPAMHLVMRFNEIPFLKARIAIALLKQDEMPHETMRAIPELQDALLPWCPANTHKFFSSDFVRIATAMLIANHQCDDNIYLPLEMTHTILQFAARCAKALPYSLAH